MFACKRCNSTVRITLYAQLRKDQATPIRCHRCGAVHSHLRGDIEVISPRMLPVDAKTNCSYSPWEPHHTRPIEPGNYHCRFTDISIVLTLWWNGRYFQVSRDDARALKMSTFQAWRGVWE